MRRGCAPTWDWVRYLPRSASMERSGAEQDAGVELGEVRSTYAPEVTVARLSTAVQHCTGPCVERSGTWAIMSIDLSMVIFLRA